MSTDSHMESLEALLAEALEDKDVRVAAHENDLRYRLAEAFEEARKRNSLSIRSLAKEMGTSVSQVQRVLHKEVGGSLTLSTLVRAADALGLVLTANARPRHCERKGIIPTASGSGWT